MDNILIIGSSGHSKVIIDIVEQEGRYKIAGLLDRFRKVGEQTLGYQVLGQEEDLPKLMISHSLKGAIVAIGENLTRSRAVDRVVELCPNLPFVSAIHPKASIGKNVSVGEGTVIMAGVVANPCCLIGRFCILNTNSSLDHDSVMEDFSSLGPHAKTGGNCRLGAYSAICIGATIIQGIHVGEYSIVGAGFTLIKNLESNRVIHGKSAAEGRKRHPADIYLYKSDEQYTAPHYSDDAS